MVSLEMQVTELMTQMAKGKKEVATELEGVKVREGGL